MHRRALTTMAAASWVTAFPRQIPAYPLRGLNPAPPPFPPKTRVSSMLRLRRAAECCRSSPASATGRRPATPVSPSICSRSCAIRLRASPAPTASSSTFTARGFRRSSSGRALEVTDDVFLTRIRAAQTSTNSTRIVLDVSSLSDYSAFFLQNPPRLIIDVHGNRNAIAQQQIARATPPAAGTQPPRATSSAGSPRPSQSISETEIESGSALTDVPGLSSQPNQVRATRRPTTAPVVASVPGTTPAHHRAANDRRGATSRTPPTPLTTSRPPKLGRLAFERPKPRPRASTLPTPWFARSVSRSTASSSMPAMADTTPARSLPAG